MATVPGSFTMPAFGVVRAIWTLANGDDGTPLDAIGWPDKTVSVRGTFGAAGSVTIEGGDAVSPTYSALNDSRGEGNALTFTAADTRTILENPGKIRPRVTAGDGTTAITVVIEALRSSR